MWFGLPSPSSCASSRDRLALGYTESVPIWLCFFFFLDRFTERSCFASMGTCSLTAFDLTKTSSESVLESLFLTDWILLKCYRYFVPYCLIVPGDNEVFQQCKISIGIFRTAESCAPQWWHVVFRNNGIQWWQEIEPYTKYRRYWFLAFGPIYIQFRQIVGVLEWRQAEGDCSRAT